MKKCILSIGCFTMLLISCKKEDSCKTDINTVAGSYKITAVTYKASPSAAESDFYNNFYSQPCERDDIITFQTNGTYKYDDAGVKCSPPNDYTGTWAMSGTTMFTIDGDDIDIAGFDCKKLILKVHDNLTNGDEMKITFTKQ
jgi:hypothetical protein